MAHEIRMPQLSQSVVEGEISRWRVEVGDTVERDQVLAEIGTDKVDVEMPSPVAGTVLELLVAEGETVTIGTPLLIVGEAGESAGEGATATGAVYSSLTADLVGARRPSRRDGEGDAARATPGGATAPPPGAARGENPAAVAKPAEPPAATGGRQPAEVPAAPPGATPGDPGQRAAAGSMPVRATPAVRKLARDLGVDLATVAGSGPGGRITAADVERAAASP